MLDVVDFIFRTFQVDNLDGDGQRGPLIIPIVRLPFPSACVSPFIHFSEATLAYFFSDSQSSAAGVLTYSVLPHVEQLWVGVWILRVGDGLGRLVVNKASGYTYIPCLEILPLMGRLGWKR